MVKKLFCALIYMLTISFFIQIINFSQYIQYAQRGFCLFHGTTADDFSLSRTNAVDIHGGKANFRRDPQCPIFSTTDKILKDVLKLLIKSVTCFSRGNAVVILTIALKMNVILMKFALPLHDELITTCHLLKQY